jgi:hypothetical protein
MRRFGLVLCALAVGCNEGSGGMSEDAGLGDDLAVADDLQMPVVQPDLLMPDLQLSDLQMPDLQMPDLQMPDLQMPDLQMPDLQRPDLLASPDLQNGCPAPSLQSWHVSPTGSDTSGTGSSVSPLKTITAAIAKAGPGDAILIHGPAVYGAGCTGGAPCDATPIQIPLASAGLRLTGDSIANVNVGGPGVSVFNISAACVTLSQLTVTPTTMATSRLGGHGIVLDGPAGAPGTIANVKINGVTATMTVAGTGIGIEVVGGAPTLGPGLTVAGGFDGIDVENSAIASVIGTTAAPTTVTDSGSFCLRTSSNAGFAVSGSAVGDVTITRCGSGAAQIQPSGNAPACSIDHAILTNGGSGLANTLGIIVLNGAQLTIGSSIVSGFNRNGIEVDGNSQLSVTANTTVTANGQNGILCSGTASVKLRGAILDGNTGNGLYAFSSCVVDLGSNADPGNNDFNHTTGANGLSGVCLQLTTSTPIAITGSTFSCGRSAAGCGAGTPTTAVGFCTAGVDIAYAATTSVSVINPTCCN